MCLAQGHKDDSGEDSNSQPLGRETRSLQLGNTPTTFSDSSNFVLEHLIGDILKLGITLTRHYVIR